MKCKVYIKGVQGRGNEVIKALTDLGAENRLAYDGEDPEIMFFISHNHVINGAFEGSELAEVIMDYYREIRLPEQWKDGDLLAGGGGNLFAIFSYTMESSFVAYMLVNEDGVREYEEGVICRQEDYRLATDEEAKRFHELLHKHGKEWDAEKKKLVKWKRKPKFGETYYIINDVGIIGCFEWQDDAIDYRYYDFGNCFPTREEAEALAEKIKELFKGDCNKNRNRR